jgi:pSer/pThr/pTyr-binding forkhead associated (FHA) protein
MPKIIVSLPNAPESAFELTEDTVTIGRLSDNTIQIEDPSVSSHHAEVVITGGQHVLRDLQSTNGTRVNGHRFTEGQLRDGDHIQFGKIDARYASDNPSETRPLPEQQTVAAAVAENSALPQDFSNASPFKTKTKKKDPAATGILAFAGLAVIVFIGAVVLIFQLQPPQ